MNFKVDDSNNLRYRFGVGVVLAWNTSISRHSGAIRQELEALEGIPSLPAIKRCDSELLASCLVRGSLTSIWKSSSNAFIGRVQLKLDATSNSQLTDSRPDTEFAS